MASRDYFKGKRVALIGLGPHGEMVEDAEYLIKAGAILSIYDLRSEARMKSHLVFLRSIGLANYVCGSIPVEDLQDMELIILSNEYPRDSSFLKEVAERKIQIEYPDTLFFKLAPPVTFVGVVGACGKSTVISMLAPMLHSVGPTFVIDPESANGILAHLKKIKNGDILIVRMTDEITAEMRDLRMSPQVAVFPVMPPRKSYSESPFEALEFQTYNNFLIASDEIVDVTRLYKFQPRAKMLRTKASSLIPSDWEFAAKAHDRENAALALQAAKLFKVDEEVMRKTIESWRPLKGRVEMVKKVKTVEFYNDTAAATPMATISGLVALADNRNIVLIIGGADGGYDYRELCAIIPQYVHTVILMPGSGTLKERRAMEAMENVMVISAPSIEEAVRLARENARAGDKVLFSPAFGAAGIDASRKERGERFVRAVRAL